MEEHLMNITLEKTVGNLPKGIRFQEVEGVRIFNDLDADGKPNGSLFFILEMIKDSKVIAQSKVTFTPSRPKEEIYYEMYQWMKVLIQAGIEDLQRKTR